VKRLKQQSGFTLIEIVIALALITVMAALVTMAFDGSRSRAQALIASMSEIGSGNVRLKNDTGCYVNMPFALYDPTAANTPSNNYCGETFNSTWNGPYVTRFTATSSGGAEDAKVSAGVDLIFGQESGGIGSRYFVRAENVPADIIKQAMIACNDSQDLSVTFDNYKCRASVSGGGNNTGTFDMLYDETR
jgi:prepilin-type N-terminal cleavage/methylation domain-containing protein